MLVHFSSGRCIFKGNFFAEDSMYRLFYICLDKIACEYNADIKTEDLNNYRFLKLHNENISSAYDMAKTLPVIFINS